ncbi:MAG: YhbY family RNA-binding protein [Candidatus Pacearchaeota archaeon]
MKKITTFQIGKFGVTSGAIGSLELALKNHKQVRISVLKASGRNRENITSMAEDIISKLKEKCDYKIIGFTIVLTKRAKNR